MPTHADTEWGVTPNQILLKWSTNIGTNGDGWMVKSQGSGSRTRHRVKKTTAAAAVAAEGRFPMKTVAEVIGVSRSNLADRLQERSKKRIGRPPLPDDELVSKIKAVIAELATYGYRRVHAALKRQAPAAGLEPANHKRGRHGAARPRQRGDRAPQRSSRYNLGRSPVIIPVDGPSFDQVALRVALSFGRVVAEDEPAGQLGRRTQHSLVMLDHGI